MLQRLALLGFVASACGPGVAVIGAEDEAFDSGDFGLTVSSADAAALLTFVNHESTTAGFLDNDLKLDTRAVKGIFAHRNGPDGRLDTADDDLFDSVAELDAISYVGDVALSKMLAWALAHPLNTPELVEGVAFTSEQVAAVVWGVNQTTSDELDGQAGLDTRAANNLLAKKPFTTIAQMGAVAYVGTSALSLLRDFSDEWAAKRAGTPTLAGTYDGVSFDEVRAKAALRIANTKTLQELLAGGLPISGAAPIIGNRPFTTLSQVSAVSGVGAASMAALHRMALLAAPVITTVGDGDSCDAVSRVCGVNSKCSGLTLAPTGTCRPAWMSNTFRSGTVIAIPDANAAGASMGLTVFGLASVPEDVIVHLELNHPRKQDLRIILTQPSSAESVVWEVDGAGDARVVMGGSVERDSEVNGVWALTVIDTVSGNQGTLNGWSLELSSRMD